MVLFSTFGHFMLQQSDRKAKLFNVFIGVVALKSDSLWFHFGQLMVQVTTSNAITPNTANKLDVVRRCEPKI